VGAGETIRIQYQGAEHVVPRPTHGVLDAALAAALAQRAALGCKRSAQRLVDMATAVRDFLWPEVVGCARPSVGGSGDASDLLDAVLEAIEVHAAGAATAITFAGILPAGCREFLVGAEGEVLRERTESEPRPADCATGCPEGFCARRELPPVDVLRAVREWRLCGGRRRACLPRAGGLAEQDTATVFFFSELDDAADVAAAAVAPADRRA
jgi:hypothetical protein